MLFSRLSHIFLSFILKYIGWALLNKNLQNSPIRYYLDVNYDIAFSQSFSKYLLIPLSLQSDFGFR